MISPRKLLDCLAANKHFERDRYVPLHCAGIRVGWLLPAMADELKRFSDTFAIDRRGLHLSDGLSGCEERSQAVANVVRQICHLPGYGRWNDEYGAIAAGWEDEPLFYLPRCATKPFGVRSYGSHVNGFVERQGELHYWAALRATSGDYSGYLDTLAGGYIAAGIRPSQAAASEIDEEAGVGHLSGELISVGRVRGFTEDAEGTTPYTVFCFDLRMTPETIPNNRDGEIASFVLLGIDGLVEALAADKFKFNAVPVIVDWLVRHGGVDVDEPAFPRLIDALSTWDPD